MLKITRSSLLLVLSITLLACAKNQAKVDSSLASDQVSQVSDKAADVDKIMKQFQLSPIFKEVLTTEQLLTFPNEEADLNLTDEQVKKLDDAGLSFLNETPSEIQKMLSPEQIDAVKRGNNPNFTQEQIASMQSMMAGDEEENGLNPIAIGVEAPDFELEDNYGKQRKLSDFRGKYVLIDFWATWCGPCVASLPRLARAYQKVDKSKVEFISVCSRCDDFIEFLNQKNFSWIQLNDLEVTVSDAYGVIGFPMVYLIGPDGKVVYSSLAEKSEEELLAMIAEHTK